MYNVEIMQCVKEYISCPLLQGVCFVSMRGVVGRNKQACSMEQEKDNPNRCPKGRKTTEQGMTRSVVKL
jgi:hypothetical protein